MYFKERRVLQYCSILKESVFESPKCCELEDLFICITNYYLRVFMNAFNFFRYSFLHVKVPL